MRPSGSAYVPRRVAASLLLVAALTAVAAGPAPTAVTGSLHGTAPFLGANYWPSGNPFRAATSLTPLGVSSFDDIVVDDTRQHVFVSSRDDNAVVVMNFDGTVDTTITGLTGAMGLALDASTHTLYVAQYSATSIRAVNTNTLAKGATYALGTKRCPQFLALAGGRLWFSYVCESGKWISGIGSLTLGSGAVHTKRDGPEVNGTGMLTVDLSTPNLLYTAITGCPVVVTKYDVTGATPAELGSYTGNECSPYDVMHDIQAVPGKGQLVTTGEAPWYGVSWRTSDMTPDSVHYQSAGRYPVAAAVSSDGAWVAIADGMSSGMNVLVSKQGSDTAWSGYHVGQEDAVALSDGGLAFSGDATKLFAAAYDYTSDTEVFSVMDRPTGPGSFFQSLSLGPDGVSTGEPVTFSGTLVPSDGASAAGQTIHLLRTNSDLSTTPLLDVVTDSSGTFTFSEVVTDPGWVDYTAIWDGDADHSGTRTNLGIQVYQGALPKGDLTLSVSTTGVPYQGTVTVTASLAPTNPGNPSITIYAIPSGGGGTSVTGTLDGAGTFSHVFTLTRTTTFWASWAGDSGYEQTNSGTHKVTAGSVSRQALSGFYSVSGAYQLYHYSQQCVNTRDTYCPHDVGTVMSNNAGELVCFIWQEHYQDAWHRVGSRCGTLDVNSQAGLILYYTNRNIIGISSRVHMYFNGTRWNAASMSGWQYFRVTN